ncbi:MAG TPA: PLxRFG domain-containing protein [Nitrospiraceae bacterium]
MSQPAGTKWVFDPVEPAAQQPAQSRWVMDPVPQQAPASKWVIDEYRPSAFPEGPKKRMIDVSSSLPNVQRIIDAAQSGFAQVGTAFGGAMEASGLTPELQQRGGNIMREMKDYTSPQMQIEQLGGVEKVDWHNPVNVLNWMGRAAMDMPQYAAEVVASQGANVIGSMGAGLVSSAVLAPGMSAAGGAVAGPPGAVVGGTLGVAAGPFAVNTFLEAGSTYADLREKGVSIEAAREAAGFAGVAKGALDTILPAKILGRLAKTLGVSTAWIPKDKLVKAPSLMKELMKGSGIEAGTEAGQELIDIWTEMAKNVYTPGQMMSRILNSAAAGFVGGTAASGAEYAISTVMANKANDDAPIAELIEPAQPAPPPGGAPPTQPAKDAGKSPGDMELKQPKTAPPEVPANPQQDLVLRFRENFVDLANASTRKRDKIVTRTGEIRDDDTGAYFAMEGSTYQEAIGAKPYKLGNAIILDSGRVNRRNELLTEMLKDPGLTPELEGEIKERLADSTDDDPLDYMFVDGWQQPLAAAGRRLGYDAITVAENDDYPGRATSLYAWNTAPIQPAAEISPDPLQRTYTEEELHHILGSEAGSSLDYLVYSGVMQKTKDGKYKFAGEGIAQEEQKAPGAYAVPEGYETRYHNTVDDSYILWDSSKNSYAREDTGQLVDQDFIDEGLGIDVIQPAEERRIQQAVNPKTGRVYVSTDPAEATRMNRNAIYTGAPTQTVVKETLQNSLDSIKDTPSKSVDVVIDATDQNADGMPSITITDTGIGMDKELIEGAYSTLAKPSEKRTRDDMSGGFGIAMAAIFDAGIKLQVETTTQLPDGSYEVNSFTTTPDEVYDEDKGFDIVTEKKPAGSNLQTGTKTKILFEKDTSFWQAKSFVDDFKYSADLPGNVSVRMKVPEYNWQTNADSVDQTRDYPAGQPSVFAKNKLFKFGTKNADYQLYGSDSVIKEVKGTVIQLRVLNRGIYQFTHNMQVRNALGVPNEVIVDVQAKVKPGDRGYPFPTNRSALLEDETTAIEQEIKDRLINPANKKSADTLKMAYDGMLPFKGVTPGGLEPTVMYDNGGKLTSGETYKVLSNGAVKKFMNAFGRIVLQMQEHARDNMAYWKETTRKSSPVGKDIHRVGLLMNDAKKDAATTGGLWIPQPGGTKSTILVNPFFLLDRFSTEKVADPGEQDTAWKRKEITSGEASTEINLRTGKPTLFNSYWRYLEHAESPDKMYTSWKTGNRKPHESSFELDIETAMYKDFANQAEWMKQFEPAKGAPFVDEVAMTPDQFVDTVMGIIMHEYLHETYHGQGGGDAHGAPFAWGEIMLRGMAGQKFNAWRQELYNALITRGAQGQATIDPRFQEPLQIYREARERPPTVPELLEGTGASGPVGPGNANLNPGGPGTNRGSVQGSWGGNQSTTNPPTSPNAHGNSAQATAQKGINRLTRHLPADLKAVYRDATDALFNVTRHGLFLTQLQDQYPNNPFIKTFMGLSQQAKMIKNALLIPVDVVNKSWIKLGREGGRSLSDLIRRVEERSFELDRRLSEAEVKSILRNANLKGDPQALFDMWEKVDKQMQKDLDDLENAMTTQANKQGGAGAALNVMVIHQQINELRKKNYFPGTRFGKYAVKVKALKPMIYKGRKFNTNQNVIFDARESLMEAGRLRRELDSQFPKGSVKITDELLTPVEEQFLNMPAFLAKHLAQQLNLDPVQQAKLEQIQFQLAPGRGLVKHLIQKKSIFGATNDTLRAFNDYHQKLSGHIARILTSDEMEKTIAAAKLDAKRKGLYRDELVAESIETNYKDMQKVENEFGAIAGYAFHLAFAYNPLAAVVNLTQSVLTYSYLAKRSNDPVVMRAMGIAMAKAGNSFRYGIDENKMYSVYSAQDKVFFDRARDEGFLNESIAGNVASLATANVLTKYYEGSVYGLQALRLYLGKSVSFFQAAEEFNRRVAFQAGLEVGKTKGLQGDDLYEFARDTVRMTQFEYSRWNRPHLARGWKAPLFIFKSYLQNFMYFAGTNQGGMRFWLLMLAIGGLKAVPGSEDMLDIIDLLGTWGKEFFGLKNPKVDSERMARDLIREVGMNPDYLINGLARYSFGLTGLAHMFGLPFPAADFSSSVQAGRVVPGIRSLKGVAQGTMKWDSAALAAINDTLGVASSMGMNMTRMILEDSPYANTKLVNFPAFTRNAAKAFEMAAKGSYTDSEGVPLLDIDMSKAEHVGEVIMQFLGKRPSRAAEKVEQRMMDREQTAYYTAKRDIILGQWATAVAMRDKEGQKDAGKAYKEFSQTSPPQFVFNGEQVRDEVVRLFRRRTMKTLGLPAQRKYVPMAKETEKAFGSEQVGGLQAKP